MRFGDAFSRPGRPSASGQIRTKGCPAPKKACLASRRPRPRAIASLAWARGGRRQTTAGAGPQSLWAAHHALVGLRRRRAGLNEQNAPPHHAPRIQYDSTAVYEPLDAEYKSEDLLVSELKNMIYKRQLMLSTGEDRAAEGGLAVALELHDQILLIRKFRDAHMQGFIGGPPFLNFAVDRQGRVEPVFGADEPLKK